ncbi:MAG: RtcB family protein [Candidatus Krumholzibacteria bacterium]|nr:RtcB family protein [Candidatus Krumholzibacteria bacterium]
MGKVKIRKIHDYLWEIPQEDTMNVPGRIYADRKSIDFLLEESKSKQWDALLQVRNVACLPGIQKASLAMADIHPGYGFPIGGVGAFDVETGVVTIAGVGFDINCGVRTIVVDVPRDQIAKNKEKLANALFNTVPAGLGSTGSLKLSMKEIDRVLEQGARFVLDRGYGVEEDLLFIEERGVIEGADPSCVSNHAKERQFKQVGTLGSGNHYLEIQYVEEIFDEKAAGIFGLEKEKVVVSIHTGSRALGHQIGTDYLKVLKCASEKYQIPILEAELVAAPIKSPEGEQYIAAVKAGINCGFANRQAIGGLVRDVFRDVFSIGDRSIRTLYDVGHNNLKFERHVVDGVEKELLIHRKGATRAFGPGQKEVPESYREVGHPVLVGGTMGTSSFILLGTEKGMKETFGSAVHGAGRLKSRKRALKEYRGERVIGDLGKEGIFIMVHSKRGAAEEAPGAYKDVERVVSIMEGAGVNKRVARTKPMICIKG